MFWSIYCKLAINMQCKSAMKPSSDSIRALADSLSHKRQEFGWSYNVLGRVSDVDPGQACRICRGAFSTYSQNVVRICNALGVPIPMVGGHVVDSAKIDPRLYAALVGAWDHSTEGAEQLVKLLDTLSHYRGPRASMD